MDEDSSTKFIGSLTKFLQSLCNGYVEFQRGVELVGHIYLSIDTGEKVDYILHERVSKNDENSVTFVSNSFHAQPLDKDKETKDKANKDTPSKLDAKGSEEAVDDDDGDDDDIMIMDPASDVIGSTNTGSASPRAMKRVVPPGSDHRPAQRPRFSSAQSQNSSSHPFTSINRQHSGRPSATVTSTSQGPSQNDNISIADVKLEQISRDELLSLASQVGEGATGPPQSSSSASRSQPQHSSNSRGDAPVWVKQEVTDDGGGGSDAGWSQERDDSNSNSGSNLYPVMMHQNPAAFSSSSYPGFSGPGTSGNQSAANPFPMPGTSQDMNNLDPSGLIQEMRLFTASNETEAQRQKRTFIYSLPMSKFGAHALRQRRQNRSYIPTSLLTEEEKAERRQRVRLQVRESRLRKKQREAEQRLNSGQSVPGQSVSGQSMLGQGGFYHFPQID